MFKIRNLSLFLLIFYINSPVFSSDNDIYILKRFPDLILEISKIIEYDDLKYIISSNCYDYFSNEIMKNITKIIEVIQSNGYDFYKLGDEMECLEKNWTYLYFIYDESKEINSYGKKLSKFLGINKSYRGICLMNQCNNLINYFTNKYKLNQYIPKLTNNINIDLYGLNSLIINNFIKDYQNNPCINITSNITLNQLLICNKYIDFKILKNIIKFIIFYCILRLLITFYFHSIGNIDFKDIINSIIQFEEDEKKDEKNIKKEENENNYLTDNKDIKETKYYNIYKGLAFTTSIKYITTSKETKIIDQLLGIKFIILFFIIIYENSYIFAHIPNIGFSVYSFITGYSFFVIKFISYSYDLYKVICGAILGYVFMDYLKNHNQNNIKGIDIFKFYFLSLPFIISFIILHILQSYLSIIIGIYFFPSVQYDFFINEIFQKKCYKNPFQFLNPFNSIENIECYKAGYFCYSEFYCFIFITTLSFLLVKLEKKIIDFLVFSIYLIILVLLHSYNDVKVGDLDTLSKIYGNINMIREPHLFFLLHFLGFNFGIMYFYNYHLSYIYNEFLSKNDYYYMPFEYNYSLVKFLTQKHKYYRRIFGIIISLCIILFSFNYYFIRNYYVENNDIIFNVKENYLINFIFCYEGIIIGILFTFLLIIILICSTSPLWKKIFSNIIFLSLNKISFIIFNSCSLITTISFCTGNINPYFNLKNILLTSFPNFIFITIFSVIYGILIELPLRYFTNQFIFIKHIKNK